MCEGNKTNEDCCGDDSCGNGANLATKAKLLESVQSEGANSATKKGDGCKFHPNMGS